MTSIIMFIMKYHGAARRGTGAAVRRTASMAPPGSVFREAFRIVFRRVLWDALRVAKLEPVQKYPKCIEYKYSQITNLQ